MNVFFHAGSLVAGIVMSLMLVSGIYIIQSRRKGFGRGLIGGRVGAGVAYWRGNVFGRGVDKKGFAGVNVEQGGGFDGGRVGKLAALLRLAVGLPGKTKGGGALRGAGVFVGQQVEKRLHVSAPINRPRGRVLVVGFNGVVRRNGVLCKLVVDAPQKVESVFSMPR